MLGRSRVIGFAMQSSGISARAVRLLLIGTAVATAIATHEIDSKSDLSARLVGLVSRDEMVREAQWLQEYYAAPEGLARPQGMWIDGHPDYTAIGRWLFDVYLRGRLKGATEEQARALVIEQVQGSDEWRS